MSGSAPGAHGRLTRADTKFATRQYRLPEKWLAAVETNATGIEEIAPIDRETAIEEMLMMGLRLVEGVSRERIEQIAGRDAETVLGRNLQPLIEGGFLTLDAERLAATSARPPAPQCGAWRTSLLNELSNRGPGSSAAPG